MGGCQNCGPFLGTLNISCRIIIGTQKGTIILTTTHMALNEVIFLAGLNGLATVRQACEASEKQSTLQQKVQSLEQIKLQGREVLPRPCKSRSPCSKAQQRQDKIK